MKEKPLFFIGNPRSGTTIIFEVFAAHSELGWLSNYSTRLPTLPSVNIVRRFFQNRWWYVSGQKKQHIDIPWWNKFVPRPDESYPFWEVYAGNKFLWDFLIEMNATPNEINNIRKIIKRTLFYQGKRRLIAKLTGPPRVQFVHSIFPHSCFIHIVRDGRAVVNSLLKVSFWKRKGGFDGPFWRGGLTQEDMVAWENSGRSPIALAAVQWRRIIEVAKAEKSLVEEGDFLQIKYEDFIKSPHDTVRLICDYFHFRDENSLHDYINKIGPLRDMNYKYKNMSQKDILLMERIMGKQLAELGYNV